jgi:hypothetical protein
MEINKETISKVMSELAKLSHKKKPRSKKFYQQMGKNSWKNRKKI